MKWRNLLGVMVASAMFACSGGTALAKDVWVNGNNTGWQEYIVEESISGSEGQDSRLIRVDLKEVENGVLKKTVHREYMGFVKDGSVGDWREHNPRGKVWNRIWGWDKVLNYCLSYLGWPNYDGGRP